MPEYRPIAERYNLPPDATEIDVSNVNYIFITFHTNAALQNEEPYNEVMLSQLRRFRFAITGTEISAVVKAWVDTQIRKLEDAAPKGPTEGPPIGFECANEAPTARKSIR